MRHAGLVVRGRRLGQRNELIKTLRLDPKSHLLRNQRAGGKELFLNDQLKSPPSAHCCTRAADVHVLETVFKRPLLVLEAPHSGG